jgi:enoyl-CoA hydratase/carnithine racemase
MSASPMGGRISVRVVDEVARVGIDNPSQRNALTRSMCLQLQELMPRLDADPAIAVIILRGISGTFCAGAALSEIKSILLDDQHGKAVDQLSRADAALTSVSKPTIAIVEGACMGGGWQLASACDFIVAGETSTFGITPAKLGILYPRPGIERLVAQVGPARAKYILLSGQTFTAAEAFDLGLIAKVVADSELDRRSDSLTEALLARSRFSQHHLKRLVDDTATASSSSDADWTAAWSEMTRSPDMHIGVDAFLARTEPHFTWRPAVAPTDSRSS